MQLLSDFVSLIFPRYCIGCHGSLIKGEDHICLYCQSNLAKTNSHLIKDNFIERKLLGKVNIDFAWSYVLFQQHGISQRILHHLKYKGAKELGFELGVKYGLEVSKSLFEPYDAIIPIPLHKRKLKSRGYNQSEMFANGLSKSLNIPVYSLIERSVNTTTQTSKTRAERFDNVNEIFALRGRIDNFTRVILVDDVITTGATIESCAKLLIDAGCKVGVICLATAK